MIFHWSLNDSKSPQVSKTILSILADLNNAVVCMVLASSPISSSSSPLTKPLETDPSALILAGISVTFIFRSFLSFSARSKVLSLLSFSLIFTQQAHFLKIITKSDFLVGIKWSVCISESQRSLNVSFSRTDSGLCIYHLVVWPNFNFLHNSQWIIFPTQSCQVLYPFCVSLLHSLITWFIVSSLLPHNLQLLFCCVLSIFTLM